MSGEESSVYCRSKIERILKTIILNISFIALGCLECSKGPALLDFRDLLQTDLPTMSYLFVVRSGGSITGALAGVYFLDKFLSCRYFTLFSCTIILGVVNGLLPYAGYLSLFFALIFFAGGTTGALNAGGNVLCLDIWRGHGGDVWMHSIHFSFAIGAFLGPVLVKPFLTTVADASDTTDILNNSSKIAIENQDFGIQKFYPIVGMATILISFGYLIFFFISLRNPSRHQELVKNKGRGVEEEVANESISKIEHTFYSLMILFFFLYVGMEVVYGTFLTTFAVSCDLKLTKQEGADITAMFWGAFASMRLLSIFLAIKLNPLGFLGLSFSLCCGGSLILIIWGQQSAIILQTISVLMGIAMGPAFASAILWMEEQVTVTSRLGAALMIASSLGADFFPIILGQIIIEVPMILMYTLVGVVFGCFFMFLLAMSLSKKLPQKVQIDLN